MTNVLFLLKIPIYFALVKGFPTWRGVGVRVRVAIWHFVFCSLNFSSCPTLFRIISKLVEGRIFAFRGLQGKEEDSKGPMATAGLRLGMPKKVVVLSLDTPGRL